MRLKRIFSIILIISMLLVLVPIQHPVYGAIDTTKQNELDSLARTGWTAGTEGEVTLRAGNVYYVRMGDTNSIDVKFYKLRIYKDIIAGFGAGSLSKGMTAGRNAFALGTAPKAGTAGQTVNKTAKSYWDYDDYGYEYQTISWSNFTYYSTRWGETINGYWISQNYGSKDFTATGTNGTGGIGATAFKINGGVLVSNGKPGLAGNNTTEIIRVDGRDSFRVRYDDGDSDTYYRSYIVRDSITGTGGKAGAGGVIAEVLPTFSTDYDLSVMTKVEYDGLKLATASGRVTVHRLKDPEPSPYPPSSGGGGGGTVEVIVKETTPYISVVNGTPFEAVIYDESQKYVGSYSVKVGNGVLSIGYITGTRCNMNGVNDPSGSFTKITGTLSSVPVSSTREITLSNDMKMYIRGVNKPSITTNVELLFRE